MPPTERIAVIAIHDVAPATWPLCQKILAMLDDMRISPVTLLVAPEYHRTLPLNRDADFARAIERRLATGDEVALHGYYHLDDSPAPRTPRAWIERRFLTDREGEFAALAEADAHERLQRGLDMLQQLNWPVGGFVAPAWRLGPGARAALSRSRFAYTATRGFLWRLPDWQRIEAPALTYSARSAWRRAVSHRLIAAQAKMWEGKRIVRFALHPVDARHTEVMTDWRMRIEDLLQNRRPVTKAYAACGARLLPPEPQPSHASVEYAESDRE